MNTRSLVKSSVIALAGVALSTSLRAGEVESDSEVMPFLARFHLVLLHLPIGFIAIAFLLELMSVFRANAERAKTITVVLVMSCLTGGLVATLGAYLASEGGFDEATLTRHKWLGFAFVAATVITTISHGISRWRSDGIVPRRVYRGSLLVTTVLLLLTGHYGGNLTHGSDYLVEHAPHFLRELTSIAEGETAPEGTEDESFYATTVRPILEAKCYRCHADKKKKGDYRLDSPEHMLQTGESEIPAIVPGDPMASNLVRLILLPAEHDEAMPPKGRERVLPDEAVAIVHWIQRGARFAGADRASEPSADEKAGDGAPGDQPESESTVDLTSVRPAAALGGDRTLTAEPASRPRSADGATAPAEVDFVTHIQPILVKNCLTCHGPEKRKARLALHTRELVEKGGKELGTAVVPKNSAESPLFARISIPPEDDWDEELMPPEDEGGPLSSAEIELVRRWIDAGARWPAGLELELRAPEKESKPEDGGH